MATIAGCFAMSHGPQLMIRPEDWERLNPWRGEPLPERPDLQAVTIEQKREQWNRCMDAIARMREMLAALAVDTLVLVGDDQHENMVDDNMPPFTLYIGDEVEASTSLRYYGQSMADNRRRYRIDTPLASHLLESLMDAGFDPAYSRQTRFEGGLGHAFARPLNFLLPADGPAVVPLMVNTYYPPAPSPKRCLQFGQALAEAIGRFPRERRVAVLASGGLSHIRIVEELDASFIDAMRKDDLDSMSRMSPDDLVGGTSEIRNWMLVAAAAHGRPFELLHYVPLYRTSNGVGCAMGFARWL